MSVGESHTAVTYYLLYVPAKIHVKGNQTTGIIIMIIIDKGSVDRTFCDIDELDLFLVHKNAGHT